MTEYERITQFIVLDKSGKYYGPISLTDEQTREFWDHYRAVIKPLAKPAEVKQHV